MHRRAGGRGSERAGTACIPFSNPLSRGSLWAASCALSSASLCHSYICACLFGVTVAATTFWDANALGSSPMTSGEGKRKKERKKNQQERSKCSRNSSSNPNSTWIPLQRVPSVVSAPINKSFQGGGRGGGWGKGICSSPARRPGALPRGCGDAGRCRHS